MSHEAVREPLTDEMKQVVSSLEKQLDCHILMLHKAAVSSPRSLDAAVLAARIVCEDENPDGAWVEESQGYRDELAKICGIDTTTAFKPQKCPLDSEEMEVALRCLRELLGDPNITVYGYQAAIRFVTWAKDTALRA